MAETLDTIHKMWPVLLTIIALIVGYVELRFRVAVLERRAEEAIKKEQDILRKIEAKDEKIWTEVSNMRQEISTVLQTAARIEGQVQGLNRNKE